MLLTENLQSAEISALTWRESRTFALLNELHLSEQNGFLKRVQCSSTFCTEIQSPRNPSGQGLHSQKEKELACPKLARFIKSVLEEKRNVRHAVLWHGFN